MSSELARLIEVDANLGAISKEAYNEAKVESAGCTTGLLISFVVSSIGAAVSVGCLLGGCHATGASFGVIGAFFLFASRYFHREMRRNDLIILAYNQRDKLAEMRAELNVPELDAARPKRGRLK